jgi:hypothetical protein
MDLKLHSQIGLLGMERDNCTFTFTIIVQQLMRYSSYAKLI